MNFKKLLSYLYPVKVAVVESTVSGKLEVVMEAGKLVLHSPNSNYSYGTLHTVFQKVFKDINIADTPPNNVLILGFGVGSVASILQEECNIKCKIRGVELDSKVLDLGNSYFNIARFQKLKLFVTDAITFLKETDQQFDLIIVDVFVGLDVPQDIASKEFLENVTTRLSDKGAMLFNVVTKTQTQKTQFEEIYFASEAIFSNIKTLKPSSINSVIFAKK